jgi:hypothetical protein
MEYENSNKEEIKKDKKEKSQKIKNFKIMKNR